MNNLMARSLGIILVCIFLIAEYYSISSFFKGGLQEFSDDGLGTIILGNLFLLFIAIMAPIWTIMTPIILLFFSIAMPLGGILIIYESIFKQDSESSLLLGLGLCIAAYFYTAKIAIPIFKDTSFPQFKEFLDYLLNFIS
jgi:hypothetical protein